MARADPGAPCWTGPPRAFGVLSAAPASRKSKPSTACHSMGWASPETAKGMVRITVRGGSVGVTLVKYCGETRPWRRVKGMSKVRKSGSSAATPTTAVAARVTARAVAVEPALGRGG